MRPPYSRGGDAHLYKPCDSTDRSKLPSARMGIENLAGDSRYGAGDVTALRATSFITPTEIFRSNDSIGLRVDFARHEKASGHTSKRGN